MSVNVSVSAFVSVSESVSVSSLFFGSQTLAAFAHCF